MNTLRRVTVAVLGFLGVTAVGGGVMLVFGVGIDSFPDDWLDRLPLIDSWLLPGLVLGIGFGLGSLVTAYATATRRWWARAATALLGAGMIAWITLQLVYFGGVAAIQLLYLVVGVALVVLALIPGPRGARSRP